LTDHFRPIAAGGNPPQPNLSLHQAATEQHLQAAPAPEARLHFANATTSAGISASTERTRLPQWV